jgi:hypothetical protein
MKQTRAHMAIKKAPDYKNLPFEVHYKFLDGKNFEFIHAIGENSNSADDQIGVVISDVEVEGISFRSENAGNGSLAYMLANKLDEYLPEWLEYIEDEDYQVKASETCQFTIDGNYLVLGEEIDSDDLEDCEYDHGLSVTFYSCEGVKPAYLILDADGSKVFVDAEGYRLAQDDTRMDPKPLVTFNEEEVENLNLTSRDEDDIRYELANLFD